LPARKLTLDPGRRVFTVSDQMLAGAKVGSTLVLFGTNVVGLDGDDVLVEGRGGPAYKVHSAYVIAVPDKVKLHLGEPLIAEHNGTLKHAVMTKLVADKVGLRFTDLDARAPEVLVKNTTRLVPQIEGLAPGNYAALKQGDDLVHVLLVSSYQEVDRKRWLALGFGGAATLCDEADLVPIPIKLKLKPKDAVLAEWTGKMRRATVESVDGDGLFSVRFERAGRPVSIGYGLVMPAPKDDAPPRTP
jgi:hypothetical protein